MPRFRVSEHRACADEGPGRAGPQAEPGKKTGPDTRHTTREAREEPRPELARSATEAFLEEVFGSPRTARRFFTAAIIVVTLVGVTLLGGILGTADSPLFSHGRFEPVTETARVSHYLAAGYGSEYPLQVGVAPNRAPNAWFDYDQAHIRLPSVAAHEPLYGLRIQVVRLEPDVDPFLLWAEPGEGAKRMEPQRDDGVTLTYDVKPFQTQGVYRILLSSSAGAGAVDVKMQLAGASVLGVQGALADGPLLFAIGTTLLGLGLGSLLVFGMWRRHASREDEGPAADAVADAGPISESGGASGQPPEGTPGFGRMEYGTPGVRRWSGPGDGVPETLAEGQGKGWVIRLD